VRGPAACARWVRIVVLASALGACRGVPDLEQPARWPEPRAGAVVSEHPLATQAGLEVLARGGNAADAAVATALALAVVYPQAGNLGGGGFALWVPHQGEARALDFRETAPRATRAEVYLGADGRRSAERSLTGPAAVAVPGSPHGLWRLHQRHGSGRLSFQQLARAAIGLAQRGFEVDEHLARDLAEPGRRERFSPAARELFYPQGQALQAGALLRQPALAQTLALFANSGPAVFQRGPLAQAIVDTLDAAPVPEDPAAGGAAGRLRGWLTLADLAEYQVAERAPLSGWFRGYEVITMPPPSSGGVVLLQVLGMLEGLPLDAQREHTAREQALSRPSLSGGPPPERGLDERMLHWWIETLRAAFADRAVHLGDPDFHAVPVEALLAPHEIARRRIAIGEHARPEVAAWEAREGQNTTHLSVLDRAGNAVSLTTTLNDSFGSGIYVREAGFLLNNEMDDFALQAGSPNLYGLVGGRANAPEPRKRPLSSMTPTVLREGGHVNSLVLGSPGGPRIITAVLQVVLRVTVLGEDLAEAVARPRLHQQWSPPETVFEPEFDPGLVEALRQRRGHPVRTAGGRFASVQAIHVPTPGGLPIAVSDPRRGGSGAVETPER